MNGYENYKILDLLNTAVIAQGNLNDLRSGETAFNYQHLIDMIDQVIDYSDNYVLVMGSQIDKDIKLWNWTDNKYHNLLDALKDLQVERIRMKQSITIDGGGASDVLSASVCYLVGRMTEGEPSKPITFVRKKMNDIEILGGTITSSGDKPERLIFVSPNPVQVSGTRYLAVGVTGYEEYAAAVTNPYALSKFTRTA